MYGASLARKMYPPKSADIPDPPTGKNYGVKSQYFPGQYCTALGCPVAFVLPLQLYF